jgi:aminopeptidase N
MQSTTAATVYLKDYTVPAFLIPEVELDIPLFEDDTRVRAKLVVERNGAAADPRAPLALDIDELIVESVALNGVALTPDRYKVDARHLTIPNLPDRFELTTVSRIAPKKNTKLMGIYTSHTGFFSLCEAEGFRRITPFLDRPDVMARYTVTLHADRERYPVLLANGNLIAQGEEADGRHWATWQDPFPKPSYLFAVVAARLDRSSDSFVTRSGRKVLLAFFEEPGKLDQGAFALEALTPGQSEKLPFHMPLTIGLLDAGGHDIPLQLAGEASPQGRSRVLSLREQETVFRFVKCRRRRSPPSGAIFPPR